MHKLATAALIAAALTTSVPAQAATTLTAKSSSATAIHTGPGDGYRVIGHLAKGERVQLDECTRYSKWCHVVRLDGGPDGWVDGGYLIGSAAKSAVTPSEFMIRFGMLGNWPFP